MNFNLFSTNGGIFGSQNPLFGDYGLFSNPSGAWDRFKNGETNILNKQVADENLSYQKERAGIEDARYAEETAFNRAWAADERTYNRALQERLFEREDTALERQAQSLSNMGINPLSQQLNGLGAGNQVTSAVAPSASTRSAAAPYNDYKHQDIGMLPMLSALSGLASTINGVSSGTYQRDSLALENDRKYLENLAFANSLGVDYEGPATMYQNSNYRRSHLVKKEDGKELYDNSYFKKSKYSGLVDGANKNREFTHKLDAGLYDTDSPQARLIKDLGNLDFVSLAENIMTKFAKTGDNIGKKFGKDFGAENALSKFFSLFY